MIHELRRKTRPAALLLLGLVLLLASPNTAYCRVDRVNGSDGAEGDPIDGNNFGGGSGGDATDGTTGSTPIAITLPIIQCIVTGDGRVVWIIDRSTLVDKGLHDAYVFGGGR